MGPAVPRHLTRTDPVPPPSGIQELLFLTTHGVTSLVQTGPYCDILISKADGFDAVIISAH